MIKLAIYYYHFRGGSMNRPIMRITAYILLVIFCSVQSASATTVATYVISGADCPPGSKLAKPYSVIYVNVDVGEVTHVEHVDCSGKRTVGNPLTGGISSGYNAYGTFLNTDNVPSLSPGASNSIVVTLGTAAKIEVRDGYTGTLLGTYPSSGPQLTSYTISSSVLSGYTGKLIVVDVIRTSDNTYRGTASIPYGI